VKEWSSNRLLKLLRETMQERLQGQTEQYQWSSKGHEQQMLNHVDRQHLFVERGQG
jgi:hypothetical protein